MLVAQRGFRRSRLGAIDVKRSPEALIHLEGRGAPVGPGNSRPPTSFSPVASRSGCADRSPSRLVSHCVMCARSLARHLDWMAHLDHVEPVGIERVRGESRTGRRGSSRHARSSRRRRRRGMRSARRPAPSSNGAGARPAHQPFDLEPLRHRLVGDGVVTRMQSAFARQAAPARPRSGCAASQAVDIAAAVRRQFAVDVGVQLVLGDG